MAYCLEPFLIVLDYLEFSLSLILRYLLDTLFLFTSPIWYFLEAFQTASLNRKCYDSIVITGASGGIGRALAMGFVGQNPAVNLFLLGRNDDRLMETKQLCCNVLNQNQNQTSNEVNNDNNEAGNGQSDHLSDGQNIHCFVVDNRNRKEVERILEECDDMHPVDLLIANAGIGSIQTEHNDWFDRYEEMVDTNIIGTFNTVFPIMKRFEIEDTTSRFSCLYTYILDQVHFPETWSYCI